MVPRAAIELVKKWEGFRAKPYLCPAGVPTIGYGTVINSLSHPAVTEEQATEMMLRESGGLGDSTLAALRLCPVLIFEPEHRLAAVASFTFNLGAGALQQSTLRRKIKQENWEAAEREFHKWVWAGGRKLSGLIARRAEEAALFTGKGVQ